MLKTEIQVGGHYRAKIGGKFTDVEVLAIRGVPTYNYSTRRYKIGERVAYDVKNLTTGRAVCFKSAMRFLSLVKPALVY